MFKIRHAAAGPNQIDGTADWGSQEPGTQPLKRPVGSSLRRLVARGLATLALSSSLIAGMNVQPAAAASLSDLARMSCRDDGSGQVEFMLPATATRLSQFFYSTNGGASYAYTTWYYSDRGTYYYWSGSQWVRILSPVAAFTFDTGNAQVIGWERRQYLDGSWQWAYLGTCQTSVWGWGY